MKEGLANMFFNMTTKLYIEKDAVSNHKKDIEGFGKKALIVTGHNSSRINGSLSDVENTLQSIGTEYIVYNKTDENPSVENILVAREFALSFDPEYVIGIGGGSPLDASKAIALMLANPSFGKELLFDTSLNYKKALPVICIPTTCGTGSEVTPYSILTLHDKQTKSSIPHHIFPELSLGDGKYLSYAPDNILINTAVDALGHFIESHINAKQTSFSCLFTEKGLSMWQTVKTILLKKEKTYDDYETLLTVSSIAGMAISHTGTSLPHGMSYSLTYNYGIPHGKAVGTFLPAYINNSDEKNKSQVLKLLAYNSCEEFSSDLEKLIGRTVIKECDYNSYMEAMMSNERKLKSCPFTADKNTVSAIYKDSLLSID